MNDLAFRALTSVLARHGGDFHPLDYARLVAFANVQADMRGHANWAEANWSATKEHGHEYETFAQLIGA